MSKPANPFEHDSAIKLDPAKLAKWFTFDSRYTDFIDSSRNVVLQGQRGSGKTMTLRYHSVAVRHILARNRRRKFNLLKIGIYVPCIQLISFKQEDELLEPSSKGNLLIEHYLACSMLFHLAQQLELIQEEIGIDAIELQRGNIEFILGIELPTVNGSLLNSLKLFAHHISVEAQKAASRLDDAFSTELWGFGSLVYPVIQCLHSVPKLKESEFIFLLDDADRLRAGGKYAVNSWLAFRGDPHLSFKIAISSSSDYSFTTSTGDVILEGHDYVFLDMEEPFFGTKTNFWRRAKSVIENRLQSAGIKLLADEFLPSNPEVEREIDRHKENVRREAVEVKGLTDKKAISDYVYKMGRAVYFKERDPKANTPQYSGFSTIVGLSTGVMRSLVEICSFIYERWDWSGSVPKDGIPPHIQDEAIKYKCDTLWDKVLAHLDSRMACSHEDAERAYRLMEALAKHFRNRLLNHKTEPRAVGFTISGDKLCHEQLLPVLRLLMNSEVLFRRRYRDKLGKSVEWLYVPHRLLWPRFCLDPEGQYGRVSLKSTDLWAAAAGLREIPFSDNEGKSADDGGLFDERSN